LGKDYSSRKKIDLRGKRIWRRRSKWFRKNENHCNSLEMAAKFWVVVACLLLICAGVDSDIIGECEGRPNDDCENSYDSCMQECTKLDLLTREKMEIVWKCSGNCAMDLVICCGTSRRCTPACNATFRCSREATESFFKCHKNPWNGSRDWRKFLVRAHRSGDESWNQTWGFSKQKNLIKADKGEEKWNEYVRATMRLWNCNFLFCHLFPLNCTIDLRLISLDFAIDLATFIMTSRPVDRQVDQWMNRPTDGRINGWTTHFGPTDQRTNSPTDQWANRLTDQRTDIPSYRDGIAASKHQ